MPPPSLDDLSLEVRLPEIPTSMALFELSSTSLGERQGALNVIAKLLGLGELRRVELPHGVVFASERGEVEYFHASGALWARDAGLQEQKDRDGLRFGLDRRAATRLARQARDLLSEAGLLSDQILPATVELDQFAQLDEKGNELRRGAGPATVKFAYAVQGVPVLGPGAKSQVFAEPDRAGTRITGAFHVWREIGQARELALPPIEEALELGLLRDPELVKYHELGHRIQITRLDFGYYAMPAFDHQGFLFPAFQVEGTVSDPKGESEFLFGRFHHVASPAHYEKAGARASYLNNIQRLWTSPESQEVG